MRSRGSDTTGLHKAQSDDIGRGASGFVALMLCVLLCALLAPAVARAEDVGGAGTSTTVVGSAATFTTNATATAASGEVIVQFSPTVQASGMKQSAVAAGVSVKQINVAASPRSLSYALYSSKTLSNEALVDKFKNMPGVLAVSPNYVRTIAAVPNDPRYAELWGMNNTGQAAFWYPDMDIDAPAAWDYTKGDPDVVIANIDTGVDYTHEDLAANMWQNPGEIAGDGIDNDGNGYVDDVYGIDAFTGDSDPMDEHGHGTHTAGIMAAVGNNSVGVVGVAWQAKIMALRFIGPGGGWDADAIECILYAVEMKMNRGVNIVAINASWGGAGYNPVLRNAIQIAGNAGIVFCAAAGNASNDNDSLPFYPASYNCSNIISVGALGYGGVPAVFSNRGAASVDLFAPGVDILSTITPSLNAAEYYIPVAGDLFFDDLESGLGNWTATGDWAITEEWTWSPSPPHSLSDSPNAEYANDTEYAVTSRALDLSSLALSQAVMGFSVYGDIEFAYDYLYVDASGDGGSTWTRVQTVTYPQEARIIAFALPSSVCTADFKVRFVLDTNSSNRRDGVYIDNVGIGAVQAYAAHSGTSMACPHVAGTVALLAAVAPSDSASTRRARILSNARYLPSVEGLCATDGFLNARAAVATCFSRYEQAAAELGYAGIWTTFSDALASGGSYGRADSAGAMTTVQFDGTYLAWFATKAPEMGIARVSLDNGPYEEVDLYATWQLVPNEGWKGYAWQENVWQTPSSLSGGTHTLRIEWTGKKNPISNGTVVNLDAFDVKGSLLQAPTRYQDTAAQLGYAGTWTSSASSSYSGGSYKSAGSAGATVTVKFNGSYLAWVATGASKMGKAKVSLDYGTPQVVDLYRAGTAPQQKVWETPSGLASGTHTVVIQWTGDKNASSAGTYINADAFDVIGSLVQAPTRYQDTSASLGYAGSWSSSAGGSYSGGSYKKAATAGGAVAIRFTGNYLAWIANKTSSMGIARVSLDYGTPVEVDLYKSSTAYQQKVWETPATLASGTHTLMIEWTGKKNAGSAGTYINVDAFDTLGSLSVAPVRYQQDNAKVLYSTGWTTAASTWASASGYRYVSTKNAKVTVKFTGTSITWVGAKSSSYGKASITLDGVYKGTVDLYSASAKWGAKLYSATVAAGNHTLVITCAGTKQAASTGTRISADAFDVLGKLY